MESKNTGAPWMPNAGMGGLVLSFGILIALISRGVLTVEGAHGILDEQMSLLEELQAHKGTGPGARVHIAAGLNDLLYLRNSLQGNLLTRLPD
jgi:hypothetical protein